MTSQVGNGSVFSLTVPAGVNISSEQACQASANQSEEPSGPDISEYVQFKGRVLVAEDAPTNQMLIKLLLEKMGLEVTIVKDGRQAVNEVGVKKFDAIFMDIHMPNMNGYEATRAIRRKEIETPIIALTANAMKGDDLKCLAAGCTDYLPKPLDRKNLVRVLQKYLASEGAVVSGRSSAAY